MPADAGDREPAPAHAVIALGPADQLGPPGLAARLMVGASDLQGGVDRLRAGIDEEDMVYPLRREVCEPRCVGLRAGMAHLEGGDEIEPAGGGTDRLGDPGLAMAGVDAPEPGHAVEHAPPVRGDVVHALRPLEQQRRLPKGAHRRKRHPEGIGSVVAAAFGGTCWRGHRRSSLWITYDVFLVIKRQ